MSKLPIGIIGTGHLGALHAKMIANIPAAEFVGLYDMDNERATKVAADYNTRAFKSMDDLLHNVKAVSIAATTTSHYAIASRAIDMGVHLFIEKPITHTTDEAERLVRSAKEKNILIQVGHIERFNPALMALETYKIQPMFIESHRLAQFNPRGTDVAVVLDLMIHDIDIILSLVKSEVTKIEANGVAVVSDNIDIANARLQFLNGCVANVTASRISQKKMRKMRLFQKDAYISVDFSECNSEVFRLVDENENVENLAMMLGKIEAGTHNRKIVYERPKMKEINALKYELELFVDSVQQGRQPVITGEDGLQALRVAHDIINKINQQRLTI